MIRDWIRFEGRTNQNFVLGKWWRGRKRVGDDIKVFLWVLVGVALPCGAGRWTTPQDSLFQWGCSGKALPWIEAPCPWVGQVVDTMTLDGQLCSSKQLPHFSGEAPLCPSLGWSPAALLSLRYLISSILWRLWAQEGSIFCALGKWELEGDAFVSLCVPACPGSFPGAHTSRVDLQLKRLSRLSSMDQNGGLPTRVDRQFSWASLP